MKYRNHLLAATAVAISYLLSVQGFAQVPEQTQAEMAVAHSMTDGEVKKIDNESGKMTVTNIQSAN